VFVYECKPPHNFAVASASQPRFAASRARLAAFDAAKFLFVVISVRRSVTRHSRFIKARSSSSTQRAPRAPLAKLQGARKHFLYDSSANARWIAC
jgi:hypothetical protein